MKIKDKNFWLSCEAERYYNPSPKTATAKAKYDAMVEDKDNGFIASQKYDGEFGLIGKFDNKVFIRGRSKSKITGKFSLFTGKLPQIVEELADFMPNNSVILAEICFTDYEKTVNEVGSILRCLQAKALERQKDEKNRLHAKIFDCLMLDGKDLTGLGYLLRVQALLNYINSKYGNLLAFWKNYHYISTTTWYYHDKDNKPISFSVDFDNLPQYKDNSSIKEWRDFDDVANYIIGAGGEGLVIQRRDAMYQFGVRPAWQTLKLKKSLPEVECKVLGVLEPTREYDGKEAATWPYKDKDGTLITKPYAKGWKVGVVVDYNGTKTSVSSGLTDEDREFLASADATKEIAAGELVAVVKGMSVDTQGAVRHPVLVRLRDVYDM